MSKRDQIYIEYFAVRLGKFFLKAFLEPANLQNKTVFKCIFKTYIA